MPYKHTKFDFLAVFSPENKQESQERIPRGGDALFCLLLENVQNECLTRAKCDYVKFNLIEQPQLIDLLADATDKEDFILKLSLFSDKPIVPGKTIIYFDEIQRYKDIVTKIKFLVDDKRFR